MKMYLIYNGKFEVYTDKAEALEASKNLLLDKIAFTLTDDKKEAAALLPTGHFDGEGKGVN